MQVDYLEWLRENTEAEDNSGSDQICGAEK